MGLLFVTDAEQRGLQNIYVAVLDQIRKELEKEGHQQQADVHAVHIGVGCYDDLVVAKSFDTFFHIERVLQEIEFFVLIDDLFGQTETVQGFAAEAEDSLCFHVSGLGNTAAGGVAFRDEDGALFLLFKDLILFLAGWLFIIVVTAVAELFVMEVGLLRPFVGQFPDTGQLLSLTLALLDPLLQRIGCGGVLMQIVIEFLGQEVIDKILHGRAAFGDILAAEFGLGLGFEHRLDDPNGNSRHDALSDIGGFIVFLVEISYHFHKSLTKGLLVGAALGGILSVDKAEDLFAVVVVVRDGDLDVIPLQVDNGISKLVLVGPALQQVKQAVLRHVFLAVELHDQSGIQVAIVPKLVVQVFVDKMEVLEYGIVGDKRYKGTVRLVALGFLIFFGEDAPGEFGGLFATVPDGGDLEITAESIDRFSTYPIETNRFLEGFTIVFGAGVDLAHDVHYLAEWNAAAKVPDRDGLPFYRDIHLLAVPHRVFVDTIVDHFFKQDVNTVIRAAAISKLSNVHAGAKTDMFTPVKGFDGIFIVFEQIILFCHKGLRLTWRGSPSDKIKVAR